MQNNGKAFTFLFSHSSKSRIYIRRFEISKRLLQNSLLSLVLIFGVSAFGIAISGVYGGDELTDRNASAAFINPAVNLLSTSVYAQNRTANLSPLPTAAKVTPDSGGPADDNEADFDESSIESQIKLVQTTGDQAFVPSIWAHTGKINNEFGFRRNPFGGRTYEFHAGLDIGGQRGDPVIAPAGGTVVKASWQGGYGNLVEVDHGNGLISRYAHLSKIDVEVGQSVQRGQTMAFVGSTGRSTGPHLHYEVRFNDKPVNPRRFLPPEPTKLKENNG